MVHLIELDEYHFDIQFVFENGVDDRVFSTFDFKLNHINLCVLKRFHQIANPLMRTKVAGNYERKGHKFVELDGIIVANGSTPIAHFQHVAIYQPRETMAA